MSAPVLLCFTRCVPVHGGEGNYCWLCVSEIQLCALCDLWELDTNRRNNPCHCSSRLLIVLGCYPHRTFIIQGTGAAFSKLPLKTLSVINMPIDCSIRNDAFFVFYLTKYRCGPKTRRPGEVKTRVPQLGTTPFDSGRASLTLRSSGVESCLVGDQAFLCCIPDQERGPGTSQLALRRQGRTDCPPRHLELPEPT